jgi:hypothetical protein
MKQLSFVFLLFPTLFSALFAQKPPALSVNATAYNHSISIAENFNIGRRFEEINKNLPVGSLGHLTLPADFDARSTAQKALFLVNSERICRNNLNYGTGALVIKPLQGVETNLSEVAQMHADWLVAQNKFEHCGNPVFGTNCSAAYSTPNQRMNGNLKLQNGWERTAENIGLLLDNVANSPIFTFGNERTIYDMIYVDAPTWGHRDNFLQSVTDNFGNSGAEGFLGVGEKQAAQYNPTNAPNQAYGKIFVYDIYDPKTTATNVFSVESTASVTTIDSAKYYHLIAKHSGKVLGVAQGSLSSGGAIVQTTLANVASQKWKIKPTANGFYQLTALQSGQALDVRWGAKRRGARLNQWATQSNSASQEWQLVPATGGYFKLINRNSGLMLSVPIYSLNNNTQLVQLNDVSFSGQLWQLVEVAIN